MQRSKLDDIYSLSNKITRKEFVSRLKNEVGMNGLAAELLKYMDIYTGKVKNEICIIRDKCPLCDLKNYNFLFTQHGFDHMLCDSCDLIFTLQVLDNDKIKFLQEGQEGSSYGQYKENPVVSEYDRRKFEIVFDELEKYTKIKNIFDFGSQSGTFLDWASAKYSIIGHEYHEPLRQISIRKGHMVLNDELANIKFDREFDLITCWDYIDHVLNPKEVIKNLSKYLKKGGLFFFAINNRDSLSARVMHKDSPLFIGPHHTMHYGINQLKLLMDGYELLHSESYVSELNWISNWLNFKNPEDGDAPLMFDLLDPIKICELGMGIKLNAIFRKK
ncbi:MAG: class I SAM-dependent methyltransferase [Nitrosotalea sp.]